MIELANLLLSTVTALAATYLALVALRHSAKPRIQVVWQRSSENPLRTSTGFDDDFIFDVFNVGHWYAKPPAREIVIEFRCPSFFRRVSLLKGGVGGTIQAAGSSDSSPAPDTVLQSGPFTLFAGEKAKFAVSVDWPKNTVGGGVIGVRAYSADGATYCHDFSFSFEQ